MGSILFMMLEGEEDMGKAVETAVAASKPRTDLVNADIRSRWVKYAQILGIRKNWVYLLMSVWWRDFPDSNFKSIICLQNFLRGFKYFFEKAIFEINPNHTKALRKKVSAA